MLNFNIVQGCGYNKGIVIRYKDMYHIGYYTGTYEETVEVIKETMKRLYDDETAYEPYIAKINEVSKEVDEIDIEAFDSESALISACYNGYIDIVKYLVEHGVKMPISIERILNRVCHEGHLDIVKYLVEQGVDINNSNGRPLNNASDRGHLDIVKYLIEKGAKVTIRALDRAIRRGYINIVKVLLENDNKKENIDYNELLDIAILFKHYDIVDYLNKKR